MLATFSEESRLKSGLVQLNCAESNFAKISGVVSKTRLIEGLAGQNNFNHRDAERMLETLDEMRSLQEEIDLFTHSHTPVDWSRVEEIRNVLCIRRIDKIAKEIESTDEHFSEIARKATAALGGTDGTNNQSS
jgi:hypothetical protein